MVAIETLASLGLTVTLIHYLTKLMPVTPKRRWITLTDASAAMTAKRPLSSAMRSNDDIDRSVHSLRLSFQDFPGLPICISFCH